MSLTIEESNLPISAEVLEELPIDGRSSAYPYPGLAKTDRFREIDLPVIVATTQWYRLVIAPSLGGRILSFTGIPEAPERIEAESGSRRGVRWRHGIQLVLDGQERMTSLGPIEYSIEQSGTEGQILLAESASYPLSWHLILSLTDESPEIEIEAKIYNRSLYAAHYNAGLAWPDELGEICAVEGDAAVWNPISGAAFALRSEGLLWRFSDAGLAHAARFLCTRPIGPHQLDTWSARLAPLGRFRTAPRVRGPLACAISSSGVELVSTGDDQRLKVVLLAEEGETLEASVMASREVISVPFGDLKPREVLLLDESGNKRFRWTPEQRTFGLRKGSLPPEPLPKVPRLWSQRDSIEADGFDLRVRSISEYLLGARDLSDGEYLKAAWRFEQALAFNAEDHLAWWMRAVSQRMSGDEATDGPELPNAHFLAPLEPALRVEAYLRQPIEGGSEVNPLLAPLAENRDAVIDVAVQLINAGLHADAARLLDEIRRRNDFPMLRYLLAYLCVRTGKGKLDAEAAMHVSAAANMEVEPPFPVRPFERHALVSIQPRSKQDERLAFYASLAQSCQP